MITGMTIQPPEEGRADLVCGSFIGALLGLTAKKCRILARFCEVLHDAAAFQFASAAG